MNAEYGDITRTRPEAFRVKTSGVAAAVAIRFSSRTSRPSKGIEAARSLLDNAPPSRVARGLSAGQLIAFDFPPGQIQKNAAQHALAVLAARIDAKGAPDPGGARGLVDVAVEPKHGLMGLDRLAHRLAPGPVQHHLAGLDDLGGRVGAPVEQRAGVEGGVDGRVVEVEDTAARVGHLGDHLFNL